MKNRDKAKGQLIEEIKALQSCIRELEKVESKHQRTEEALKESEGKLNSLLDAADDGIAYVDPTGKILSANKKLVEDMLGYTRKRIAGRNLVELGNIEPKDLPRILKALPQIITTGKTIKNFEVTLIKKDGVKILAEIGTGLIRKEGKIVPSDYAGKFSRKSKFKKKNQNP